MNEYPTVQSHVQVESHLPSSKALKCFEARRLSVCGFS